MIWSIEGNTSVQSGKDGVQVHEYVAPNNRINCVIRPNYKKGEALRVIQVALKYRGYYEKASREALENFTANPGNNNYNRFADYAYRWTKSYMFYNNAAWCVMYVMAILIEALGVERAKEIVGEWANNVWDCKTKVLKAGGIKRQDSSYSEPGDLIFFEVGHIAFCSSSSRRDIIMQGHSQTYGDLFPVLNGQTCGTTGLAKRLESIRIDGIDSFSYQVHQQTYGDSKVFTNGQWAGVTGESKRLEAIKVDCNKKILYRVHLQTIGWTDWVSNGMWAGTKGERRRLEAVEIKYAG